MAAGPAWSAEAERAHDPVNGTDAVGDGTPTIGHIGQVRPAHRPVLAAAREGSPIVGGRVGHQSTGTCTYLVAVDIDTGEVIGVVTGNVSARMARPCQGRSRTAELGCAPMLFPKPLWAGLADGSVTVAFRRWKRPTVRAGGTLRTPVGVLAIDAVEPISEAQITDADARLSGAADRAVVLAVLPDGADRTLYRIAFHHAGEDPRVALRERADLDDVEVAGLCAALDRLDEASADGPWTRGRLALIAAEPGVRAADLAAQVGEEVPRFKRRVRRLKALGLTESLRVGYRLSPRGRAFLDAAG